MEAAPEMEAGLSKIDEALEVKALRRVIGAYLNYSIAAEEDVRRYERSYSKLASRHKELLSHLSEKYAELGRCISVNSSLILTMLRNFEPPFEMGDSDETERNNCEKEVAANERHLEGTCMEADPPIEPKNHKKTYEEANGWRYKNNTDLKPDYRLCQHHEYTSNKRLAVENEGTKSAVQGPYKDVPPPEENSGGPDRMSDYGEVYPTPEIMNHAADWFQPLFRMHVPPSDVDKVRCVLRNIVRDWAVEGSHEREKCYKPILEELQLYFPSTDKAARPNCLVPGAGLGRLALEISRLGFVCQGNEFSYYMLICSSFILNNTLEPFEWTIHPWIHSNCNKVTDKDQLQAVRFPDLHPGSAGIAEGFSMCAGDFVEVYSHPNQAGAWDAVVTCFFVDTAHNIVEYIEIISRILKPGGVWINLGPLLYHFADAYSYSSEDEMSIELSLEDVKKIAFHYGFQMKKEATLETTYTACPASMMQNHYYSAFWTMIKE